MRFLPRISRARVGPGAAFVVTGTRGLADFIVLAALEIEAFVIAAEPVDRGLHRAVARLDHAGAADPGDTAIVGRARRHGVFQPADRARGDVGGVTKGPRAAAAIELAHQRTIGGIARHHRRTLVVAARPG